MKKNTTKTAKKDYVLTSLRLERKLFDKLKKYATSHEKTASIVMRNAIINFIDQKVDQFASVSECKPKESFKQKLQKLFKFD